MLHLTRLEVAFSMSWQSGVSMCAVIGCVGGTHALALRVTCAAAGAASAAATIAAQAENLAILILTSSN
jgi:hypothetical protein